MMKKIFLMLVALIATSFSAMAEDVYIVAGSYELCGTAWDAQNLNNKMTDNGDGTYSKTFTNVAAMDDYQVRVVKNRGEDHYGDEAGNDIFFNVTTACDVTITLNPTTRKMTVTGSAVHVNVFKVEKVVAVGNGKGTWLNGVEGDPTADVNKMKEVADKVYEITFYNVPVGEEDYMVKFTLNGSWRYRFGGTFEASGKESVALCNYDDYITFNLEKEGSVKIRLDLSKFDYATNTGAKFMVTFGNEQPELTYFMKHPWGGGEWTWKPMEKNTDERFALGDGNGNLTYGWIVNGKWGNEAVFVNSKYTDVDRKWLPTNTVYDPQLGEDCRFYYYPLPDGYPHIVRVIPERVANAEVKLDPAPGTYTGPLTVRVKCLNMPSEISEIEYCLNSDYDNILNYDDAKGIVLTENTILEVQVTLADGHFFPIKGEYVINMPTGVNDITTTATTKAQKVIENGQVLIIKDGKKYNLLGNQVK